MIDQQPGRLLIAGANARQPALDVGRRFIVGGVRGRGHGAIEVSACTLFKTPRSLSSYHEQRLEQPPDTCLDSPRPRSINFALMQRIAQALRLS